MERKSSREYGIRIKVSETQIEISTCAGFGNYIGIVGIACLVCYFIFSIFVNNPSGIFHNFEFRANLFAQYLQQRWLFLMPFALFSGLFFLGIIWILTPEVMTITGNIVTIKRAIGPVKFRHKTLTRKDIIGISVEDHWVEAAKGGKCLVREIAFNCQNEKVYFGQDLSSDACKRIMEGPLRDIKRMNTS